MSHTLGLRFRPHPTIKVTFFTPHLTVQVNCYKLFGLSRHVSRMSGEEMVEI
ncbi:hypothetical protein Hanom_Chr08g00681921 [Helianthus anomalus]